MRTTFKLIKKYPNSPHLGTILSLYFRGKLSNDDYCYIESFPYEMIYSVDEIENYPEFWEEVNYEKPTELSNREKIIKELKDITSIRIEVIEREMLFFPNANKVDSENQVEFLKKYLSALDEL